MCVFVYLYLCLYLGLSNLEGSRCVRVCVNAIAIGNELARINESSA